MKNKKILLVLATFIAAPAFASVTTECAGKFAAHGKISLMLTTAADDPSDGTVSVMLFSGLPTSMPVHYQFGVIAIQNSDSDSDVSILYKDTTPSSKIKIKVNDNPAMGASYVLNLPGFKKIALSCKAQKSE